MEILITITNDMIRIYMLVCGALLNTLVIGYVTAKIMRKFKMFRSKADEGIK